MNYGVHYKVCWHHKPSGDCASANMNSYMRADHPHFTQYDAKDALFNKLQEHVIESYPIENFNFTVEVKAVVGLPLKQSDFDLFESGDQTEIIKDRAYWKY